jgi:protein-L-isoaspartate(D-aspartate) O-methyltransferase
MHRLLVLPLILVLLAAQAAPDDRAGERERMVLSVANLAATVGTSQLGEISPRVLAAMRRVPRHLLVPGEVRARAYENEPLPIGYDATISQPYIVALMTDLLRPEPEHRVLEVGTGSGYQAAVLSGLVGHVYTIEIVEPLARRAARDLSALGYRNVTVRAGDGYAGWPSQAPFDRIIVTAAAPHVPRPLIDQLRPGGRMVIPVNRGARGDMLVLVEKRRDGRVRQRDLLPVRFVPLVRSGS